VLLPVASELGSEVWARQGLLWMRPGRWSPCVAFLRREGQGRRSRAAPPGAMSKNRTRALAQRSLICGFASAFGVGAELLQRAARAYVIQLFLTSYASSHSEECLVFFCC